MSTASVASVLVTIMNPCDGEVIVNDAGLLVPSALEISVATKSEPFPKIEYVA